VGAIVTGAASPPESVPLNGSCPLGFVSSALVGAAIGARVVVVLVVGSAKPDTPMPLVGVVESAAEP
jgi:hypothetical protein